MSKSAKTQISRLEGLQWLASRHVFVLVALLIVGSSESLMAQVNDCFLYQCCERKWTGNFSVAVTGQGVQLNGFTTSVNNSASASFETTGDTTEVLISTGSATVRTSWTCQNNGGEGHISWSGNGPLTNVSVGVFINDDCTYSLKLECAVPVHYSARYCPPFGGTEDFEDFLSPMYGCFSDIPLKLPLPPFGQPLKGEIVWHCTNPGWIETTATISWNLTPFDLQISSVNTPATTGDIHSFVSTDPITLKATVGLPRADLPVKWTVLGADAAEGIEGFPKNEVHKTDASGTSTLVFRPSDYFALVLNRHLLWKAGSRKMNPPISFIVIATLEQDGVFLLSTLESSDQGRLSQDERDILRQEYVDFEYPVPAWAELIATVDRRFNNGPYPYQLSVDLPGHYAGALAAYRGRTVPGFEAPVRADARVTINSAFRNPQLNVAVGSRHNRPGDVSLHVFGRALDLAPVDVPLLSLGARVEYDRDLFWFPALLGAAATQGHAIAEKGCCQVPLSDPRETHIHVNW